MEQFSGVLVGAHDLADLLTWCYRETYAIAADHTSGSPRVAVLTWIGGSFYSALIVGLAGGLWYGMLGSARWHMRRLLILAARGLDSRKVQPLVAHYVRIDRAALKLQRPVWRWLTSSERWSDGPFVAATNSSRCARLMFWVPRLLAASAALFRALVTSYTGWFTILATWWAMQKPGWGRLASAATGADGLRGHVTLNVAVVGVAIAIATFLLARMRGVRAAGHHAWRRQEGSRASEALVCREVTVDQVIARFLAIEPSVRQSWSAAIVQLQDACAAEADMREIELRMLLDVQSSPVGQGFRVPRGLWGREQSRVDPEARAALAVLEAHLDEANGRTETTMRRHLPWRVVNVADEVRLRRALREMRSYVEGPPHGEPDLRRADWYARTAAARVDQRWLFSGSIEEIDVAGIPASDRIEVLDLARQEWSEQTAAHCRDLAEHAHGAWIDALIGLNQLELASTEMFAYLQPSGRFAWVRDRLLPG